MATLLYGSCKVVRKKSDLARKGPEGHIELRRELQSKRHPRLQGLIVIIGCRMARCRMPRIFNSFAFFHSRLTRGYQKTKPIAEADHLVLIAIRQTPQLTARASVSASRILRGVSLRQCPGSRRMGRDSTYPRSSIVLLRAKTFFVPYLPIKGCLWETGTGERNRMTVSRKDQE